MLTGLGFTLSFRVIWSPHRLWKAKDPYLPMTWVPNSDLHSGFVGLCFISLRQDLDPLVGSSGDEVVKHIACGASGPGFKSRSRRYDFRDWLSPATKSQYG